MANAPKDVLQYTIDVTQSAPFKSKSSHLAENMKHNIVLNAHSILVTTNPSKLNVKNTQKSTKTVPKVLKTPSLATNSPKNVIIGESSAVPKPDVRPLSISKFNQKNGSIDTPSTAVSAKSDPIALKHTVKTTPQSNNAIQTTRNDEKPKSSTATESDQIIPIAQSAVLQQETTLESSIINVASNVSI